MTEIIQKKEKKKKQTNKKPKKQKSGIQRLVKVKLDGEMLFQYVYVLMTGKVDVNWMSLISCSTYVENNRQIKTHLNCNFPHMLDTYGIICCLM